MSDKYITLPGLKACLGGVRTWIDSKLASLTSAVAEVSGIAESNHADIEAVAEKLESVMTDEGSTTQPIFFKKGVPQACSYTLGKSVPSDAEFTDTTYSVATTSANGLMSKTDKQMLDIAATADETVTGVGIHPRFGGFVSVAASAVLSNTYQATIFDYNSVFFNRTTGYFVYKVGSNTYYSAWTKGGAVCTDYYAIATEANTDANLRKCYRFGDEIYCFNEDLQLIKPNSIKLHHEGDDVTIETYGDNMFTLRDSRGTMWELEEGGSALQLHRVECVGTQSMSANMVYSGTYENTLMNLTASGLTLTLGSSFNFSTYRIMVTPTSSARTLRLTSTSSSTFCKVWSAAGTPGTVMGTATVNIPAGKGLLITYHRFGAPAAYIEAELIGAG